MNSIGFIVAWLAGCALGLLVIGRYPAGLDPRYGIALLVCGLLLIAPLRIAWADKRARWSCILALVALFGCGRALLIHPPITPYDLAYYNTESSSGQVQVIGSITAEPVALDRWQRVRVSAREIRLPGHAQVKPVSGDMLTLVPRYPEYGVGERLSLTGQLTAPPRISGFDYGAYLARQGVYSYMAFPKARSLGRGESDWLAQTVAMSRKSVSDALRRSISEPEAALTVGVVVGDRTSIPQDVQSAFQVSGTTHVLAISGQNIALIIGFIWLLYSRAARGQRMPVWLTLVVLVSLAAYTLFTGATPSVVRAAVMASVLLPGPLVGRRYDPVAALGVSAVLMSVIDPDVLADAGFLLSFGAMLGIALVSPRLLSFFEGRRLPTYLGSLIAAGIGAQAITLPLVLLLTGRVSLVSSLATLCIDIALLPLMIAGIITGIIGTVLPSMAAITGLGAWLCAAWMVWCVRLWASLPFASVTAADVNPASIVFYYCAFGAALWLTTARGRGEPAWLANLDRRQFALALTAVAAWVLGAWVLFRV